MKKNKELLFLSLLLIVAILLFGFLYYQSAIPTEKSDVASENGSNLEEWSIENSSTNNKTLEEDKGIYEQDSSLYDVYINIFPTEDADGNLLDFSSFDLHQSRDHTYNPVLNCNVRILREGEKLDPFFVSSVKNATIRVRGNSSRGDVYKSYKVKFDKNAEGFKGFTTLNINKHSEDVMKVSTKLCTDLLADIPNIGSFRTYFFRLWICDASLPASEQKYEYYGLYTDIEQPNLSYLKTRGLPSNCVMYKARDFSFHLDERLKNVDEEGYSVESFEEILGIREGKDHSKLLQMLKDVNDSTKDFASVFATYFDEDNFLTWLAFNLLIGNDDIINHNFIIYSPNNSTKWYFIPWDFDGALHYGEYESSLMKLPDSLKGGQKLNQNVLCRRYFRIPGNMEKIEAKMRELLDHYLTEEKVNTLLDSYIPVLEKTMTLEPDIGLLEMPPSQLTDYVYGIHDYLEHNYNLFQFATQYPTPMFLDKPKKNEDGTIYFSWEPSFSYQQRTITYNLVVADDYNMNHILIEKKGLVVPEYTSTIHLQPGTYYLKVTAVDSEGHEQLNMERYETMLTDVKGLNVNGVLQFTIE